jgi:hypothetical protein
MWRFPVGCEVSARDDVPMDENDNLARLRAEEVSDELAIRNGERSMARVVRQMEDELREFAKGDELAKRQIEGEWRCEHGGREPEHSPDWPTHKR